MANTKKAEKNVSFVNYIGLAVLVICYVGAIWNVIQTKKDEVIGNKKVIRLVHWQLETGIRDALQVMIDKYQKSHPDIKIIQIPLTEKVYRQWVTTQLLGRTAPDLIELGKFDVVKYCGKYFVPLTNELRKPNHYNSKPQYNRKKTFPDDTPWMDTFTDGLRNNYITQLMEYYGVGFSQFSIRLFYNRDKLREITGSEKFPKTFQNFLDVCKKIQQYTENYNERIEKFNKKLETAWWENLPFMPETKKDKMVLYPVASSKYQVILFRTRYASMLTSDRTKELDYGCDGTMGTDDTTISLISGAFKIDDPKYKIGLRVVRDMAEYFPPGFMSIQRMDAGFSFVQGQAVMITSGSWDASSFLTQIERQPYGDLILEIDGKKINSTEELKKILLAENTENKKKLSVKIERDGAVKNLKMSKNEGVSLRKAYGMRVENFFLPEIFIQIDGETVYSIDSLRERINELKNKNFKIAELYIEKRKNDKKISSETQEINLNKKLNLKKIISDTSGMENLIGSVVTFVEAITPADKAGLKSRKRFEVGIVDMPLPGKNDPVYGKYFVGKVVESSDTGFNFGLTKFSSNKKIAVDFLKFCTTPENNEKFNSIAQWIPAVRGAEEDPALKAFVPNFKGFWGWLNLWAGGNSKRLEKQIYWPYVSREIDFEEYSERLNEQLPRAVAVDYLNNMQNYREKTPDKYVLRSKSLAKLMFSDSADERKEAQKKLRSSWEIIIDNELGPEIMEVMLQNTSEDKNKNKFSKEFFKYYEDLKE